MNIINLEDLNKLIEREENIKNSLEPHTLDWYTYWNRVKLLQEVLKLVTEVKEVKDTPKKVSKAKNEDKKSE